MSDWSSDVCSPDRFRLARHRAHVALGDDAAHVFFRPRLQPDGEAVRQQMGVGGGLRRQAAAGGDHLRRRIGGDALQRPALEAAIGALAVKVEDLVQAEAGFDLRSEEHTSELQSLMRISYAVFCLKKKNKI